VFKNDVIKPLYTKLTSFITGITGNNDQLQFQKRTLPPFTSTV